MSQVVQSRGSKAKISEAKEPTLKKTVDSKQSKVQPSEEKSIAADKRHGMIAEAAYLLAEQRGFQGNAALDDWLQAENEIDALLSVERKL